MQTTEARRDKRATAVITGAVLLLIGGLALGGVPVVLILVAATALTAAAVIAHPSSRRLLAARAARRLRLARRERRETRLEEASLAREPLGALTDVATRIEHDDPHTAGRLDLAELLDAYVDLAIGRQKLERITDATTRASLVAALDELRDAEGGAAEVRRACLSRRLRLWDDCRAQADRCAAEMAAIAELIRMLGEHALVHDELAPSIQPSLARRLEDLADQEASVRELTGD